jgi:predicted phage tail protein
VSGSTVLLRWRPAISGARPTGYVLEAGSTPGDSNVFVLPLGDLSASFTARNVKGGTYFVRVRASNAGGASDASNEAKVVVGDCTAPPSAPSGLSFSLIGSAVVLTWEASKSGPTSYIIETETGSDGTSPGVVDTGSLKTTFTAEDVPPGTYFVRVRARNACGGSARSEKVTVVVR